MKHKLNALILIGKSAYFIGMLLVFNFLFGWIFFGFLYWLLFGSILLILLFVALILGKNILFKSLWQDKAKKVIDVEAKIVEECSRNEPGGLTKRGK